ncbi:MAG: FAD-binding protein [Acidobacteria bacterium]|nr:FAD-binding protein [Acidobacteriota bacterium]
MNTLRVLPNGETAVSPPYFSAEDTRGLEAELRRRTGAEVRFDAGSRGVYAVDGSNYRQVPIGAVIPRSIDDVVETIAVCREFGAPVLSRGGGTSLCGQCCNTAIVIDWSKHLNRVLHIDWDRRLGTVQPGTVCDDLRNAAGARQLTFGPDPATHTHCTFGGMLGNNSCGVHAQMAGKTVDNTDSLEILTYSGHRMRAGWMHTSELARLIAKGGPTGEILRQIKALRDRYATLIEQRYPKIPRRVSGYNLDQLIPNQDGYFNLARALVGSEGTLVTILEATMNLVHNPPFQTLVVLGYPDIYTAGDAVPAILEFKPMGFEAIDGLLVKNIRKKHLHEKYLDRLPQGNGWLLVQFGGETREEADSKARELISHLNSRPNPPNSKLYDDAEDEKAVWKVRESGLGATAFVPGEPVTWEGWEDSAVAPDRVGDYLRDLCKLYQKHGYEGALYGHFGMGCIHTRITFDLMSDPGIRNFRAFLDDATDLVTQYGGSISGEHGDGQSKAEFLYKMFGPELIEAFREFKSIWDPDGKMNPGKVVDPYRVDQNLRLGATYPERVWKPQTHFQWPDDHGEFWHATLRCVGVGECRRHRSDDPDSNTMCPSYMVTMEEEHSTRGRAHLLWEMLQGEVITEGWRSNEVKDALDLCLSCKGCKGDCPVNVDMATYKAEFLSHYWEGRLRPRSAYAYGLIDQWARMGSRVPGLVNLAASTPGVRELMKWAVGMPRQRRIPEFAPQTFQSWFGRRPRNPRAGDSVILWADTFNNFFLPQTARAAVEVLEHAGYQVQVLPQHLCCGRPLYDYGFLDLAKKYLMRILNAVREPLAAGTPIVVLEPSCASVLRDEIKGLFPERDDANKLAGQVFLFSEFLHKKTHYTPPPLNREAIVHGHCHHKAIMKMDDEKELIGKMKMQATVLPSGCCGMAGSFGFEKDKYDVSIAVGEHTLLPAVRKAGLRTYVIADGFSCREQIEQTTDRHALHLAEVVQSAIQHGPTGASGMLPERAFIVPHQQAVRRSKLRAGVLVGAAAALGVAAWLWHRR